MEWWMKRRQLPSRLRRRVSHFERQSWLTTGGVDEMELIKDLPEGLRRDIKRYLCLDLIKKVIFSFYYENADFFSKYRTQVLAEFMRLSDDIVSYR